jgi:hypothetical protein
MIKKKWMRWGRNVAQMEEQEFIYDFCWKTRRKETTRKTEI